MSTRTIPDYPWKLFERIAQKPLGNFFVLPSRACSLAPHPQLSAGLFFFSDLSFHKKSKAIYGVPDEGNFGCPSGKMTKLSVYFLTQEINSNSQSH